VDPRILKLEVTSRCNARCVFCGHGPGGEDMTWELYTSVIDAFPEALEVQPQWYGEPLLWPHLADGIRYAKERGHEVSFATNASLLSGSLALDIAAAEPNEIRYSVDSHIPEVFEAIRPPLSFETVKRNIEAFQRIKGDTRTRVALLETQETRKNIETSVRFWRKRVDIAKARPEVSKAREVPDSGIHNPCIQPYTRLVVRADGQVNLCCTDWGDEAVIGHYTEGIREVWQRQLELYSGKPHRFCRKCFLVYKPAS